MMSIKFKPSKLIPTPLRKFANNLFYMSREIYINKISTEPIIPRVSMKDSLKELEDLDTTNN